MTNELVSAQDRSSGERCYPTIDGTCEGIPPDRAARYKFASSYAAARRAVDLAMGCGYGALLLRAGEYVGVDNHLPSVLYARRFYAGPRRSFLVGDVCRVPLPSNVCDLVVSFETLEHLPREQGPELLSECARITRRGGRLILSTPVFCDGPKSRYHLCEYGPQELLDVVNRWYSVNGLFIQDPLGDPTIRAARLPLPDRVTRPLVVVGSFVKETG